MSTFNRAAQTLATLGLLSLPSPLPAFAIGGGHVVVTPTYPAASQLIVVSRAPQGGMCSATLIAPDLVLTAAHCVTRKDTEIPVAAAAGQLFVHYGNIAKKPVAQEALWPVIRVIIHPEHGRAHPLANDLALLKLAAPAPASLEPAPLPEAEFALRRNDRLSLFGFGRIYPDSPDEPKSALLRSFVTQVKIPLTEKGMIEIFRSRMLPWRRGPYVSGTAEEKRSIRESGMLAGDSGGGAFTVNSQILVGVASGYYGPGCAADVGPDTPDESFVPCYTSVAHHLDWLRAAANELDLK